MVLVCFGSMGCIYLWMVRGVSRDVSTVSNTIDFPRKNNSIFVRTFVGEGKRTWHMDAYGGFRFVMGVPPVLIHFRWGFSMKETIQRASWGYPH